VRARVRAGWSLFVLVLVNSYAANLVAFLIKEEPTLFKVNNIEEAVARKAKICVWQDSAAGEVMASLFAMLNVVPTSGSDLLVKLRRGECEAAVDYYDSFRIYEGQNAVNPCCDLLKRGEVIYPSPAGWAGAGA
jgi:hypothetical protein